MIINFHFRDLYRNFPLNQKIGPNKECVNKVINAFPKEEIKILENQNILFFFDDRTCFQYRDRLGATIIKNSFDYEILKRNYNNEIKKIHNFFNFGYIIYLSKQIGECDNKIFKSLTIAHELQHVLQNINIKCIFQKSLILRKYLELKGNWTNKIYRNMPVEADAFIKEKKINYDLYTQKKVDDFLDKKIDKLRSRIIRTENPEYREKWKKEKSYWDNIKFRNINKSYDLEKKIQDCWNMYESEIENEFQELKNKRSPQINEQGFIYEYRKYKKGGD